MNQATADTYHVVDSIYLHFNAHTLAIDPVTHRLFVGYSSLVVPPRVAVFTPNRWRSCATCGQWRAEGSVLAWGAEFTGDRLAAFLESAGVKLADFATPLVVRSRRLHACLPEGQYDCPAAHLPQSPISAQMRGSPKDD